MGLQVGTHLLEGLNHSRLHVQRVQPVQEQQVRDQLVLGEDLEGSLALLSPGDHLHHARQTLAVEVQENLCHLRGFRPGVRVRKRFDLP
jgi:hypothetical protein